MKTKENWDRQHRSCQVIGKDGQIEFDGVLKKNEEVIIQKKKKELTPQQIKFLENRSELSKHTEKLGGYIHMGYVKNELLFDKLDIDKANISRLIYLSTFIEYNNKEENLLIKRVQNNEAEAMTRTDIKKVMKLNDTAFKSFLSDIKKNKLLYEADGRFYISPDFFTKGVNKKGEDEETRLKNKEYTRVFIDTTRYLYEKCSSRQHKQLSYVFQLVPYINYELNILCSNPQETNFYELDKLNLVQICKLIGVNTDNRQNINKMKNELLKFKVNVNGNDYGFLSYAKIQNGYGIKDYFVVNPQVVWKGREMDRVKDTINLCFFD